MFIKRFQSITPKNNQIRRFCHKSIESHKSIEKKEKYKTMLLEGKMIYLQTVPIVITGTVWLNTFSFKNSNSETFLEHMIYSITTGCLIGIIYPVSFPVIAFNVWLKRNESPKL